MEMLGLKKRIIQIFETNSIRQKEIAEDLGKNASTISTFFKKTTKPNLQMTIYALEKCPSVSAEWLMRGTGEMENEHNNVVGEPASEYTKRSEKEEHLEWRLRVTEKYCKQLEQYILQHCRHGADKVLANKPKS